MSDINNYSGNQNQSNKRNFNRVFVSIKEWTDSILVKYEDKDFSKDPSVDIEGIAYNEGIKEISLVPPEEVNNEHSWLNDDIIYLNKENIMEEWLFSIAHEVAHYEIENRLNDKDQSCISIYRVDTNLEPEIPEKIYFAIKMRSIIISYCSDVIANAVSKIIGKPVSHKNARIILRKMAFEYYSKKEREIFTKPESRFSVAKNIERKPDLFLEEIIKSFPDIIKKIYDEEIADYFAANLLVPTERFLLWEDKSDEAIAQAFNVALGCIQKRREEIEDELYFMSFPKEHILGKEIKFTRGNVVGIGKVKIPLLPMFCYNIKWLSFLDVQKSENSFVSICVNLRIDGYGETREEAENDMFDSVIYFLYQNFSKLSLNDAWENLNGLYKPNDRSKKLWDVYHEAQGQIINEIELMDFECQASEEETYEADSETGETQVGLADIIRKITNGLIVRKTHFKVTV